MSSQDQKQQESTTRGGAFLFTPINSRPAFFPENFSDQQREFFRTARKFSLERVVARAEELEAKNYHLWPEILREAGDLGLLMIDIGEEYGGMELDKVTSCLISEATANYGAWSVTFGAHVGIGTLPIVYFGNEEQKAKYLPKLATGELVAAYALSEAGSGSDALGASTRAVLSEDGQHWILNGSKQWITNAGFADVFVIFAKIDGDKFSGFIVDRDTPGFSLGNEENKMGLRGSSTRALIFENAKIPVGNLLGEPGKGHRIAFNILNIGRLKLGVGMSGACKMAMGYGAEYGQDRKQFKKAITEFGLVREKFARAAAVTYAIDSMSYRTAGLIDEVLESADKSSPDYGAVSLKALEEYAIESSIMKVYGSERFAEVVDQMLQVHGGYGFVEEYPIERSYRDERVNRIFEGTNEINRLLIPGMLFKRAMKGDLPLMEVGEQLTAELKDPSLLPSAEGPLGAELRQAELAKRQILFASQIAAMKFGPELDGDQNQSVLGALADAISHAYAMDSVVTRTLQVEGGADNELRKALVQWVVKEGAEIVYSKTREVIASCTEGDERGKQLALLARLYEYVPYNTTELREAIAPAVLEANGYPLEY